MYCMWYQIAQIVRIYYICFIYSNKFFPLDLSDHTWVQRSVTVWAWVPSSSGSKPAATFIRYVALDKLYKFSNFSFLTCKMETQKVKDTF